MKDKIVIIDCAGSVVINNIVSEGTYFGIPVRKISLYKNKQN